MARGAGKGRLFEGRLLYSGKYGILLSTPPGPFRDNLQHWLGDFTRLLTVQFKSNEAMSNVAP